MEIEELVDDVSLSSPITVAVAVNGDKSSLYAVKWSLEKFTAEGRVLFRILHVRPKITMVPTPMGNYLPISQVREEVASAHIKDIEWKTNALLLPYKKLCAKRKVEAEAVVIEEDDVAHAISREITKFKISKLVLGASPGMFSRKYKSSKMVTKISECVPDFCTVYVVSKGKLLSVRTTATGTDVHAIGDGNSVSASYGFSSDSSSTISDTETTATFSMAGDPLPVQRNQALAAVNYEAVNLRSSSIDTATTTFSLAGDPLPVQRNQALAAINHEAVYLRSSSIGTAHSRNSSICNDEEFRSTSSSIADVQFSYRRPSSSFRTNNLSGHLDKASTSGHVTDSSPPEVDLGFELEKLRIELKHLNELCQLAQTESVDTSRQINELSVRRMEEEVKLKEIWRREANVRELAREERKRREEAEKEIDLVNNSRDREAWQRRDAETSAAHEAAQKLMLEKVLANCDEAYKKYSWEEIEAATCSLSDSLKIGSGGNGVVYKASFHHTVAAVKILHSDGDPGTKQFNQELEILGRIQHPHLLLLLGACPERGCLVYEYMENGSLDDRLSCKDNTPPLPWFHRFRIAWEVASALVFLHGTKPEPIIHRDLKPANILLDENFVSKIGDVGLSTLLPTMSFSMTTMFKDTAPVGTFCYIDPEYQRTGLLSAKSDVYALGMVILQLLTGRPPMGLTHTVETAVEHGTLMSILDSKAGRWPGKETRELARLGLCCTEIMRKDRPDLQNQILPTLERLKTMADNARNALHYGSLVIPNHFICPILQEVMDDPCVASDGYTYDRRAIETWLGENDTSPMTNLQLPNKDLIPDQSLLSAIKGWKSRSK